MNLNKNPFRGFSLLETTVSLAILAMIAYLVLVSTVANKSSSAVSSATIFLNSQARSAVMSIRSDLMQAKASSVCLNSGSCTCGGDETLPCTRIRFQVPLVDSSGNLTTTSGGDVAFGANLAQANYYCYALNGTALERQIVNSAGGQTGISRIIARNVTNFTVIHDFNLAQYNITLSLSTNNSQGTPLPANTTLYFNNTTISVAPRN
jgi:prepilin-type N-terminal cleavage/methylation domain-containing protein